MRTSHGIGAIADHVPESLIEAEPGAYEELTALEAEISTDPAFRALAPQVHVFAQTDSLALTERLVRYRYRTHVR